MPTILKNDLTTLLQARQDGPFVSIYLETNPVINDLNQQKLAYRQAVSTAKIQFNEHFPHKLWQPIDQQLIPLITDNDFWLNTQSAWIGLIANADQLFIFKLNTPVKHQVTVATMPTVLPIIKDQQQTFDFDLLCLNEDSFTLYQKDGQTLTQVNLPDDAPVTLQRALGTEVRGGDLNFHSGPTGGGNHNVSYHGHNTKDEEREIDQRNYYQTVDQYLLTNYSRPTNRRLILCALPQNQAVFRQLTKNPYLLNHLRVEKSAVGLSKSEIGSLLAPIQSNWQEILNQINLERFDSAQSQKLTLADPFMMITPAISGRIQTLLVAEDSRVNGTITANGATLTDSASTPDNLIDDLADIVLAFGGNVQLLPANQFPTQTKVAAILRY